MEGNSPSPSVRHHAGNNARGRPESIDNRQEVYRVLVRNTIEIGENLDVEIGDEDGVEYPNESRYTSS